MLRFISILIVVGCRFDLEAIPRPCTVAEDCLPGSTCTENGRCMPSSDGGTIDVLAVDTPGSDATPVTSCAGVTLTCGASSCCESISVPGGTFYRVFDGVANTSTAFSATVSSFKLDKFEVTVGRFRQFVAAGFGTQANPPAANAGARNLNGAAAQGGWDLAWNAHLAADSVVLGQALKCNSTYEMWRDVAAATENKPINCVTWYEAMAFCIWDGGYLPTDAERHFVASGGSDQRYFPWSSPSTSTTISGTLASYMEGGDCLGDGASGCSADDIVEVGAKSGDGLWGHSELGGNLWEWILDWQDAQLVPCVDCARLAPTTTERAIRGGGFDIGASTLQSTHVYDGRAPEGRIHNVGFRCAR